jgi:large subunit ribosomal protein L23
MVTLRRPPTGERKGPKLEPYQVVIRPIVTEKATHLANPPEKYDERGQTRKPRAAAYSFEVHPQATKTEIKHAVEALFDVKVADVRTQNRRGKTRRYRLKEGRTRHWKKAIVRLHAEHRIDFY